MILNSWYQGLNGFAGLKKAMYNSIKSTYTHAGVYVKL